MSTTVWKFLEKLKGSSSETDFAVLVLNRPILSDVEIVKSLWNKASLRAAADGGSNRWLEFLLKNNGDGLKLPDFISGDFDSIKPQTRTYFEEKGTRLIHTPDQDETDFTKALRCIREALEGHKINLKWVFVLCEHGGRFDQEMANINTLHRSGNYLEGVNIILVSSQSLTWLLKPGNHTIYVSEEYVRKHLACGIIPFSGPTIISTSGLKWNLDNQTSEMGELVSTSNTYSSKEVNVTCNKCVVWTMQYCEMD